MFLCDRLISVPTPTHMKISHSAADNTVFSLLCYCVHHRLQMQITGLVLESVPLSPVKRLWHIPIRGGEGSQSNAPSVSVSHNLCVSRPPGLALFIIDDQWALRPGKLWAPPRCAAHTHARSFVMHTLVCSTKSSDLGKCVCLWCYDSEGSWLCYFLYILSLPIMSLPLWKSLWLFLLCHLLTNSPDLS